MNANFLAQSALFLGLLLILAWPLGLYMAKVYAAAPGQGRLERLLCRLCGARPDAEMNWKEYAAAVLIFSGAGLLAVYGLQRLQGHLPLNPAGLSGVGPLVALNTAVSFVTNTNWQAYSGETTMSLLTQMLALAVQNFLSAATGLAVLAALIRGLTRHETAGLGNFWVDLSRSVTHILLPLSVLLALVLVWQGVPQTFRAGVTVPVLDKVDYDQPVLDQDGNPVKGADGAPVTVKTRLREQTIALGPVASQVAIKQLGTNGGGFYNVNSAHPLENPTPLSNFLEMLAILLIPAGLCFTFGRMAGDMRQGVVILAAMTAIFVGGIVACQMAEQAGNPALTALGVDQSAHAGPGLDVAPGGNMEGKESRLGIVDSTLWAVTTTVASNGSVNAMHDSFTALGGLVPMVMMQLGEVVYGGVGSGLYGMLVFAVVAVFIAGLMVGRTPEYLGKKIEAYETKMAALVILIPPLLVLGGTAAGALYGTAATANPGPHALSEILYAFSSMGNNNGSAFAGLTADGPFYTLIGGLAMYVSRFWLIVPVLALAGSLAAKKTIPAGGGTLPTHGPLFCGLLVSVVLLVGALSFIPALALGPVAEHLSALGR